ncbi:MAG: right-handed parallel beta-helix repeat-containing protein [Kofleriaceae bacterium]
MKLAILLVLVVGCTKQSEKYCAMHPEDTENCPTNGEDGGTGCLDNAACVAIDPAKPVCTGDRECVECTPLEDARCTQGRVCGADNTCGDCTLHAECDSRVCQTGGRCADPNMVAYVAATGAGSECTLAMPCSDLQVAEQTTRPIIKVSGTISHDSVVQFNERSTTIYADPGASVTRSSQGNIIEVSNDSTVLAIFGLRIFGATSTGGTGNGIVIAGQTNAMLVLERVLIDGNYGSGVRATDGGIVTIRRSVIANNTGNQGIYLVNGQFDITNTIIAQNGTTTIGTGGAYLLPQGPSTFEFNTVADNVSSGGATNYRGITCANSLSMSNNIIVGNDTSQCEVSYSFFTPGDRPAGTGNLEGNPMFRTMTMPSSAMFYRIAPRSPAKNAADTNATLSMDIDGNMRPIDGRSDMGADEVSP